MSRHWLHRLTFGGGFFQVEGEMEDTHEALNMSLISMHRGLNRAVEEANAKINVQLALTEADVLQQVGHEPLVLAAVVDHRVGAQLWV